LTNVKRNEKIQQFNSKNIVNPFLIGVPGTGWLGAYSGICLGGGGLIFFSS